jgi:hypothetical protein
MHSTQYEDDALMHLNVPRTLGTVNENGIASVFLMLG